MGYIVYIESFEDGKMERWYYGSYDYDKANDVAIELNHQSGDKHTFYCVCKDSDANGLHIQNLPQRFSNRLLV